MSVEADLFSTLGPLVGNRVYPESFIQPNGALPAWPAIRYDLVSEVPVISICNDSGDDALDTRVQLDVVAKGWTEVRILRQQVMQAMRLFVPPATYEISFAEKDEETKTYRVSLEYLIQKSSSVGSP